MDDKRYIELNGLINDLNKFAPEAFNALINKIILNQPTDDVQQVRHGKWLKCFEDYRKQILGDKCSVCGFEHYSVLIHNYQYCPNCGAKMDS